MESKKKKIRLEVIKEGNQIKGHHTPNGCNMGSHVGSKLAENEENTSSKKELKTN